MLYRFICNFVDLEVEFESDFLVRLIIRLGVVRFDASHESGNAAADVDKECCSEVKLQLVANYMVYVHHI